MKRINLLLGFYVIFHAALYGQGSGKAINFGAGTNAQNFSVHIANTFPNITTNFTITAWIYSTNNALIGQRIFEDDASKTKGYGFSLGDPGAGRLRIYSRGTSTGNTVYTANGNIVLANNQWYYVAAVINRTVKTCSIYVNGVLDVTVADARTGTWGTDAAAASFGGEIPTSSEQGLGYFVHGQLDEVIVWNSALTQAQLRTAMCLKQPTPNAAMYGYWNLDGAAPGATNVPDLSGSGNAGTMAATMTGAEVITSGASIGDASTQLYSPGTWAGQTLTLPAAANGTTFTVTAILPATGANAPTGVQLYQVNSVPSIVTGITGLGNNNVYYGVYVVNGVAPSYNVTINYTAYDPTPLAQLFYRNNNASTWNAGNTNPAPPPYTITEANSIVPQQEYILGATSSALPVELTSFSAVCSSGFALLQWTTATETNNSYYTIERSGDGVNFLVIGRVKGAVNSSTSLSYSYTDSQVPEGTVYYRLAQTDLDGNETVLKTEAFESCAAEPEIHAFQSSPGTLTVQLNLPQAGNYSICVYDVAGRLISTGNVQGEAGFNTFRLNAPAATGVYFIRALNAYTVYTAKFFIAR